MNTRPFFQVVPNVRQALGVDHCLRCRCHGPIRWSMVHRRPPRLAVDDSPLQRRWPVRSASVLHLAAWPWFRLCRRPPARHAPCPLGPRRTSGSSSVGIPALFRAAPTPRITLWSLRTDNSFRPAILLVVRDSPDSPADSRCTLPLRPDSRNQPLTAPNPPDKSCQ